LVQTSRQQEHSVANATYSTEHHIANTEMSRQMDANEHTWSDQLPFEEHFQFADQSLAQRFQAWSSQRRHTDEAAA
jgi:hypothetical protein